MLDSAFFLGYPVEFKNICLIYPPKVKDVATNEKFSIYLKMLTFTQEEIEDEFVSANIDLSQLLTPLQYILNLAYNHEELNEVIRDAFMFFIHEPVTFLYEAQSILIGELTEKPDISKVRLLNKDNFFEFQNMVRFSCGEKAVNPPDPNENPRVKAMKAKARYRDKIKAKSPNNLTLKTIIASVCCMNLGLTPLNIGELSYMALGTLFGLYQDKEKYELDIQSLLAGADSKKIKPKYWIRNPDN